MKRLLPIITLAFSLSLAAFTAPSPAASEALARDTLIVITARATETSQRLSETVTRKTLERIYMKRKTLWKSGEKIVPVNLSSSDPLRKIFTEKILQRGHRALVEYWNGKHFIGINPPVVLQSEEAVKRFLRKVPGSIGYIRKGKVEDGLIILYTIKD